MSDNRENGSSEEILEQYSKEMPKLMEPGIFIIAVIASVLGAIVGMQVLTHTGVAPDTSVVGALLAVLISQIPIRFLKKFKNIHCQNLVQTSTSGATFSAANCMLLTIGVPYIMGYTEFMYPMLIGVTLATIVDATILYKSFGSPMFPADAPWPPGIATAETILATVRKGKRAGLLVIGAVAGWAGAMAGIPMDLFGVAWVGSVLAIGAFGVGALIVGIIESNAFAFTVFGHDFVIAQDIFGKGFVAADHVALNYMGHGIMIGAGIISLVQCGRMLFKKVDKETSAAGQFGTSIKDMRSALGKGFIAYLLIALGLAIVSGLWYEMKPGMFILWILFAAVAALVSELIVGVSAMYSGWFPGVATALIFLILGMLIGFPKLPLAVLAGFTAATGPCFSDMGNDLKAGYILRGRGKNPEFEKAGRKQQYFSELLGFAVAFVIVAIFAKTYFSQGLFPPINATYASTIEAGSSIEVLKWLAIWAIPGAVIQIAGGNHQVGILFATGILVGGTIYGLTVIIATIIRIIVIKKNPKNDDILMILGAGSLVGCALHDFANSMLGAFKSK